ncbi:hypothetical protein [Streptomyces sp. NPDC046821]|uniref:hypothetical protein n=1 Tax=Streptomyces sp. NPDC046821 TaxID=3154702 RepID=UPI0034013E90
MSWTRRPGLLARGTFVAAVLGGALLVPTAAFAHPDPDLGTATEQVGAAHDGPPLFLVAGGGMAAVGGAGLAYSMYQRGRTDGDG